MLRRFPLRLTAATYFDAHYIVIIDKSSERCRRRKSAGFKRVRHSVSSALARCFLYQCVSCSRTFHMPFCGLCGIVGAFLLQEASGSFDAHIFRTGGRSSPCHRSPTIYYRFLEDAFRHDLYRLLLQIRFDSAHRCAGCRQMSAFSTTTTSTHTYHLLVIIIPPSYNNSPSILISLITQYTLLPYAMMLP